MSEDRIKELQGFADDFKHRLKQDMSKKILKQ